MKEFQVRVTQLTESEFFVTARTPEEAETVVETLLMDGEVGEVLNRSVEMFDVVEVQEGTIEDREG